VVATSGTTGTAKGVVLTHSAVEASARATSRRLAVGADDHWLACLPLSHVGGLSVVTRALVTDTALTVHPEFDPTLVQGSDATLVSLVATALTRIDPTQFRVIVLGGGRPPADGPVNVVSTYGMTETGSGVVYDGIPLDGVEAQIRSGEIELRGPMLLRAYRDGTDPKDADGWLQTGDMGRWLDDGRLHIDGRRDDMIITGGENVWPEAVETVLRTHPAIADVLVRGRPDPEWGDIVEAVVVPAGTPPSLADLRKHVKLSHPSFLAPKSLVLVDSLPRTSIGKLRRHPLDPTTTTKE
jgi:O-succinylbenzoic acid--CoA ligase